MAESRSDCPLLARTSPGITGHARPRGTLRLSGMGSGTHTRPADQVVRKASIVNYAFGKSSRPDGFPSGVDNYIDLASSAKYKESISVPSALGLLPLVRISTGESVVFVDLFGNRPDTLLLLQCALLITAFAGEQAKYRDSLSSPNTRRARPSEDGANARCRSRERPLPSFCPRGAPECERSWHRSFRSRHRHTRKGPRQQGVTKKSAEA